MTFVSASYSTQGVAYKNPLLETPAEKLRAENPLTQTPAEKLQAEQKEQYSAPSSGEDCESCKNRKYMDGSDDMSVSYQSPTHISARSSAGAVASHEREHVFAERAKAQQDGREVRQQSVSIKYAACAECGKMYASGGMTRTVTAKKAEAAYKQAVQQGEAVKKAS